MTAELIRYIIQLTSSGNIQKLDRKRCRRVKLQRQVDTRCDAKSEGQIFELLRLFVVCQQICVTDAAELFKQRFFFLQGVQARNSDCCTATITGTNIASIVVWVI